jgi:hypothetical protein
MDKLKAVWKKFLSLKKWQKAVVIFLTYLLISSIAGIGGSSDSPSSDNTSQSQTANRSYPVEYVRHAVINPATVSVAFNIKNDGTQPIKPTCNIKMQDAGGTYKGYDIFEITDEIAASQTKQVVVQLTITKEGAEYVDQFIGDCTAITSDTASSAGKAVVISEIKNMSATDGSEGWYWGASFKSNQKPMTQMDCTVKALDKDGNQVAMHSYRANTVNEGLVIPYGQNERWDADASKSVVLSIKSFDVECTL